MERHWFVYKTSKSFKSRKQIVKQVFTIRASSLSDLFDCPARWAAKHIDGKHMPSNGKAMLGKAIHASTAVFDQSVIDGTGITVSEAAAAAVDTLQRPDEEVAWDDEDPRHDVEKIALALHDKYCTLIAPKQEYAAIEVSCNRLEISDLGLALTGTTDRVRKIDGGFGIADIKSGKQAVGTNGSVKTPGHTYQMGVYELLAEQASGVPITRPALIIGLQAGKTDKGQRVGTGEIEGAREVLLGDEESPGILQMASTLIHGGNFWGNPKSMLCHKQYCPIYNTCKYRK